MSCRCLVCQDYGDQDQLDDVDTSLARAVADPGWAVLKVPEDPSWAFTIGLWHSYRAPELAMFGLDADVMHELLNQLAERVKAGHPPAADTEIDDLLEGRTRLAVRETDDSWRAPLFGTSIGFYRATRGVPTHQVVWSDADGRFPWQDGYPGRLADAQPNLWQPVAEHPAGPWRDEAE
ncbi:DUF4262 domain-containing protein [Amycolatopsis sp. OK19-0408]|uniref:DUF4262 domain-containing protein n=1 Tax=Amycolatopsis iheyensis TaxID=2945988 RepID=A0A9X2NFE6_9PSEU|nr:DUF4262 domain-containing protein [Amycolatopsis iheyensis]MCR6486303.1 DUF4262 domain-containing protein [Amycolatopsis iheyensis]